MAKPSVLYPQKTDLTNCDKEPIHIPGRIQPHGALLVCEGPEHRVSHNSANSFHFFGSDFEIAGSTLERLLGNETVDSLFSSFKGQKTRPLEVELNGEKRILIAYLSGNRLIVEVEPAGDIQDAFVYQQQLSDIISDLGLAENEQEMCDSAAIHIKKFLNYDRVMIYRFDSDWNGTVVSEARNSELEGWLGLRYPATDIPRQARELFLKQGVRIIADVNSTPVPIQITEGSQSYEPVDLSLSELRAVSPIHIEYLGNMGVDATLTAAIVFKDQLWGLIACHHYSPRFINYFQRESCKFLTQVFSNQLMFRSSHSDLAKVNHSGEIRSKLVGQLSKDWNLTEGLTAAEVTVLELVESTGAAVFLENRLELLGRTPEKEQITELIRSIAAIAETDLFYTDSLSSVFPETQSYQQIASGVLCVFTSKLKKDAVIWFKPEIKETVTWAGNPDKAVNSDPQARLSPRKSFEKWTQQQQGKSAAWEDYEIAAAKALKETISEIIIEKYEEIRGLNKKLKDAYEELESFSYSVSHDLRAPLRGIDGFARIIKEDYFESLDDFGKSAIDTILSSTDKMNELIDDILSFSALSQKPVKRCRFSFKDLIAEVLSFLQAEQLYPQIRIQVAEDLPDIYGDRNMIFQMMNNLISNAFKYSANTENPSVIIDSKAEGGEIIYFVKDTGIGFDESKKENIFNVFSRLVGSEYEGSGVGLAIVKRVIDKHNGTIDVQSKPGLGTTFLFKLETE